MRIIWYSLPGHYVASWLSMVNLWAWEGARIQSPLDILVGLIQTDTTWWIHNNNDLALNRRVSVIYGQSQGFTIACEHTGVMMEIIGYLHVLTFGIVLVAES